MRTRYGRVATFAAVIVNLAFAIGADAAWQPTGLTNVAIQSVAVDTNGVWLAGGNKLWVSTNGGATFQDRFITPGTAELFGMAVSPVSNDIFVAVEDAVARSSDLGLTWDSLNVSLLGSYNVLAHRSGVMIASGSIGTWRSADNGDTWQLEIPVGGFFGQLLAEWDSGELFSLDFDNLSLSSDTGKNWVPLTKPTSFPHDVLSIAADPVRHVLYASDLSNNIFEPYNAGLFRSVDTGQTWEKIDSTGPLELFTTAIWVDPAGAVYINKGAAMQAGGVFRLKWGDTLWEDISAGLPSDGWVRDFAPTGDGRLLAGHSDSGLFVLNLSSTGCCVGVRGNADSDIGQNVDITDLQVYIDFLFFGGGPGLCAEEWDVAPDGSIDITDLQEIIDFLFFGGTLQACP